MADHDVEQEPGDDVADEPGDDAGGDDPPPEPLIHRPQGNWLEDRLEEYARRLEEINRPG